MAVYSRFVSERDVSIHTRCRNYLTMYRYGSICGVNGCQNFVKVTSNIGNLVTNGKIVIAGLSKTFNSVVWTQLAGYMNVKVYSH